MDTAAKEKDKGSQMVTIRRVMDPNNAEPTVTITLKGDQPEKDKVLFKLVNGQGESRVCVSVHNCVLCVCDRNGVSYEVIGIKFIIILIYCIVFV